MSLLERAYKSMQKTVDPYIGKVVICFTTHGCQGQNNEFKYVGTIVGRAENREPLGESYTIEIHVDKEALESRDRKEKLFVVASLYELGKLSNNLYIIYR